MFLPDPKRIKRYRQARHPCRHQQLVGRALWGGSVGVAGRLRVHYLWMAGAIAALAVLPAFGFLPVVRASLSIEMHIGGALVIAAIGDDRVLRRTMASVPRERTTV